ncbi:MULTISPECIES: helix-turn-helix domain-containing protein [unclassified Campylobacter]|uniref:helix-turn-helix domain-containing protein n=1 Tax=unclassified Campylobacter TaxID=2593542 RepID=UPI0022E9FBF8|nr:MULTISPECIES: helix-turn-helix domain-containing protein [unclassified Campylobacter]MDA3056536.1 helix-turn-helix domain-containing protein [Campylobacter sp. CN_NA1]MDA3065632.1 helix-turn-helix domain-containing protein [Campylobacter sp. CN_NE4]MDA3069173.1 helix-turn-helix domain-containing protein [Campylobacter sp. CN_NE3]MDA3083085.1 helix-turn-helix domain-containing protein [Campylobacter sp. CN_EL2]MDA3084741.1 helix-turn-helix domain-containing protein [Campylobacter sp. CN_NE1]
MKKLSINEAADILGISKEAIYNRIRRNTIKSVEENGVRFVILDEISTNKQTQTTTNTKNFSSNFVLPKKETKKDPHKSDFIEYLIKEIDELKDKIKELEQDKEKLFREKEKILVDTKDEIKAMYEERDEKLKYFLSFFEKPLLQKKETFKSEPIDLAVKESSDEFFDDSEWLSIGSFLNSLDIKRKKKLKIQNLLIENIGKSEFVKVKNDTILINKNIDLNLLKANFQNDEFENLEEDSENLL